MKNWLRAALLNRLFWPSLRSNNLRLIADVNNVGTKRKRLFKVSSWCELKVNHDLNLQLLSALWGFTVSFSSIRP